MPCFLNSRARSIESPVFPDDVGPTMAMSGGMLVKGDTHVDAVVVRHNRVFEYNLDIEVCVEADNIFCLYVETVYLLVRRTHVYFLCVRVGRGPGDASLVWYVAELKHIDKGRYELFVIVRRGFGTSVHVACENDRVLLFVKKLEDVTDLFTTDTLDTCCCAALGESNRSEVRIEKRDGSPCDFDRCLEYALGDRDSLKESICTDTGTNSCSVIGNLERISRSPRKSLRDVSNAV
jgi:hypothetical protein